MAKMVFSCKTNSSNLCFTTNTLKMLGCFNPTLGQIWTNPNIGLKMYFLFYSPMAGFVHI